MSLRVLPPYQDDLPDVPSVAGLRPGDRFEPVQLPTRAVPSAQRAAAEFGLPVDVAVALLVEAVIVGDWLAEIGVTAKELGDPPSPVVLSAAEAHYLRSLTFGRRPGRAGQDRGERRALVMLPVRLIARASPKLLERACAGDLVQALQWETAAMRAGMGMAEGVMRRAAAALARQVRT